MTASRRDSYMQRSTHTPQHPLLPSFWSNLYQKPNPHLPFGACATSIILFQSILPNISGFVHTPFSLNKYCFAISILLVLVVSIKTSKGRVPMLFISQTSSVCLSFGGGCTVVARLRANVVDKFSQQCNLAGLLGGFISWRFACTPLPQTCSRNADCTAVSPAPPSSRSHCGSTPC